MSKLSIAVLVTRGTLINGVPPRQRRLEYRIRMLPEEEALRLKSADFKVVALGFKPSVFVNPRYVLKTEEKVFTADSHHVAGSIIKDLQRGKYHSVKVMWYFHADECYGGSSSTVTEQEAPPPRAQKDNFHRPPPTRQRRSRRRIPTRPPQPMMTN